MQTNKSIRHIVLGFCAIAIISAFAVSISCARSKRTINDISLFADQKARHEGDIVTVLVVEQASASKTASTKTSRTSDRNGKVSSMFGGQYNPLSQGVGLNSNSEYEGSGSTSRTGTLKAEVSALVTEVMPNGNLMIEGKREIQVNNEKQIISVEGMVRPQDINPDNTVMSIYLVNPKIKYEGDGLISRQQKPGWLSRLLDWLWIF